MIVEQLHVVAVLRLHFLSEPSGLTDRVDHRVDLVLQ